MRQPYVTSKNLAKKTAEWKELIEPHNIHVMELNTRASALLVIDMQNYFVDEKCSGFMEAAPAVLPNVKRLLEAYRKRGLPVLFTAHAHEAPALDGGLMHWWWDELIMKGTGESRIVDALAPREDEKVLVKNRYSAFYHTDLETNLRCLRVEDIVITGVMTNLCCESTARDAFFRDYRVFFMMDATAATTEEFHVATLRNLSYGFAYVTDTDSLLRSLSSF